jgi:phosphatidylglycerol:prolipoprotein diacylglycerol transferase
MTLAVIPFNPPEYIPLVGPLQLSAHGIAFLVAAVASLTLTRRRTPEQYHRALEDVIPFMLLGAVLGARGLYFVQQPDLWSRPWKLFTFWEGGLVSYGGMLGAVLGFVFYIKWKRLPLALLCDALAPTALVGWGIGRIGCFLSWYNEYGTPTRMPWAFVVEPDVPRHPVMLYLSVCLLAAGFLLMRLPTEPPFRVTGMALMAEGVIRGVLDSWRDYEPDFLVWTSRLACLLIFLWGWWLVRRANSWGDGGKNLALHGEDRSHSGHAAGSPGQAAPAGESEVG